MEAAAPGEGCRPRLPPVGEAVAEATAKLWNPRTSVQKPRPRVMVGPRRRPWNVDRLSGVWLLVRGCRPSHTSIAIEKETSPCLILATGLHDGQIKVWEVETGKQLKVLSGHLQWVYGCSISPDGQMLCSVAGEKSEDSNLFFLLPRHVPLQPAVDQGGNFHTSSLRCVCFSPEGLYLATVADDRLLRIWALELENPVAFAAVKNGLCCTYFPHGGIIATGTRDGHAQFWTAPQALSSLKHLCRKVLRGCFTSYQVQALSIPKKMKEFLTYRTL
ncbi:hypothetical protein E2320_012611 [Naja naja]|nr:hypothetical protein E2320_012611 [Naja naja]